MKKFVILVILVMFSVQMAHPQAALLVLLLGDKVASENFYFSLKAGANIGNLTGLEDTKTLAGVNFGLLATIKINDKFSLVPEFSPLSPKGTKNIPLRATGNTKLDALLQNSPSTVRALNYIDIPVVAKYRVNERFSVGGGPYLSILTSATDVFKAKVFDQDDLSFEEDMKSELHTLDYGVVFEAAISLSNARGGKGLVVHARYQLGFTDILKDNPGNSLKNSVFQIFVSFPFIKEADSAEEK
jgi:hypothetical protein